MPCNCSHLKKLKDARVSIDEPSAVYLDYNAACPPDKNVLAHYQNTALSVWGHPDSPHLAGQKSLDHLESLEKQWIKLIRGDRGSLHFCRGAADALSLLLKNMKKPPGALLTGSCEHNSVYTEAQLYCEDKKIPLIILKVDSRGKIDPYELK